MNLDKTKAQDDFQAFLAAMDDQLDALAAQAQAHGIMLDSTPKDLERLEALFPLMANGLDKDAWASLVVSFARHLGEVVRKHFGGRWHLPLDDPKNVNFNRPVIVGHAKMADLEFAPLSVMRSYALRGKPGTLRRALMADISPSALNLDHLRED